MQGKQTPNRFGAAKAGALRHRPLFTTGSACASESASECSNDTSSHILVSSSGALGICRYPIVSESGLAANCNVGTIVNHNVHCRATWNASNTAERHSVDVTPANKGRGPSRKPFLQASHDSLQNCTRRKERHSAHGLTPKRITHALINARFGCPLPPLPPIHWACAAWPLGVHKCPPSRPPKTWATWCATS